MCEHKTQIVGMVWLVCTIVAFVEPPWSYDMGTTKPRVSEENDKFDLLYSYHNSV
jgi:hypothetical protein